MTLTPITAAFRALATISLEDVDTALDDIAVALAPGAGATAVCLAVLDRRQQRIHSAASSTDAAKLDDVQYETGAGPAIFDPTRLDGSWTGDLTATVPQPPAVAAALDAAGIRSVLSVPDVLANATMLITTFYSDEAGRFGTGSDAREFPAAVRSVVTNLFAHTGALAEAAQLEVAMRNRATIEQAKGILLATSPARTPDEAFETLRRGSQREGVKLHDIAERIVAHWQSPGTAPPP